MKVFKLSSILLSYLPVTMAVLPNAIGSIGTMGAGTYPRATVLSDGTLLGTYTTTDNGNPILRIVNSTDGGTTWRQVGSVATESANHDLTNSFLHELPSGRILCAFRNHDGIGPNWTYYRIIICYSDDKGKNWQYLSTPAERARNGVNGVWEPFMRTANDGTLQLYYSSENAGDDQDSILRRSKDGNAPWSDPQTISGAGISSRDGMLGVTKLGNALYAVFETSSQSQFGDGFFRIWSVTSPDDGQTWQNRKQIYQAPGHNAGNPQIITVGSRLVVSFNSDKDGGTWPRGESIIVVSEDAGNTWQEKVVHGPVTSWTGLTALNDKEFVVMFDNSGTSQSQKWGF